MGRQISQSALKLSRGNRRSLPFKGDFSVRRTAFIELVEMRVADTLSRPFDNPSAGSGNGSGYTLIIANADRLYKERTCRPSGPAGIQPAFSHRMQDSLYAD